MSAVSERWVSNVLTGAQFSVVAIGAIFTRYASAPPII